MHLLVVGDGSGDGSKGVNDLYHSDGDYVVCGYITSRTTFCFIMGYYTYIYMCVCIFFDPERKDGRIVVRFLFAHLDKKTAEYRCMCLCQ